MMKYRRRPRRRWQLRIGRLSARLKHHDPGSQLRHQVTQLRQPKGPGPVPAHHRSQKGPILTSPPSWTWSRSWRYRALGWSARPCRSPGARSSQAAKPPLSRPSLGAGPAADHQPQSCSPARHQLCSNKPSTAPAERSWSTTSRPPAGALLSSSVAVISVSPSTRAYTNQ